jgi:formate hydrogenlyase transcriptional activator
LHFVEAFAQCMGKHIEQIPQTNDECVDCVPGHVWKLQNVIERAVIHSENGVIPNPLPTSHKDAVTPIEAQGTLRDHEVALTLQTLREPGGMIGEPRGATDRLGLKRTTLISKMKRLGIYRPRQRENSE